MNNTFSPGDYVAGYEHIIEDNKDRTVEMRGWIDKIFNGKIFIKAHDSYNGNRGTCIDLDTAYRVNYVDKWWEANKRVIPVGTIVKHFKNKLYKVLGYADHVDGGKCVIYMALYGGYKTYIREYSEFMSEVDKHKYPEVEQRFRFEIVEV